MARRARVAVIPGDGAAPEAMAATMAVLRRLDVPIEWVELPDGDTLSSTMTRAESEALTRQAIDSCTTVLFGATSGQTAGLAYLRWVRGAYANVRPIRWRPGLPSPLRHPEAVDYVIVRENTEDLYCGVEGHLEALLASGLDARPWGGAIRVRYDPTLASDGRYALKIVTRESTERIAHFACRLAESRRSSGHPGRVTTATKWNILPRSDGYFRDVVADVVAGYPDLELVSYLADDLGRRIVACPEELDVVVLPNLYGDLFSDVGAATVGGLGVVPSGCYGEDSSYFEPIHGTAPDIAGTGTINPTATILSALMMLDHLGYGAEARRLEAAVDATIADGDRLTPDMCGAGTTQEFAGAGAERL